MDTVTLQLRWRRLLVLKNISCVSISLISFMILKGFFSLIMSLNNCISLMTWQQRWTLLRLWIFIFLLSLSMRILLLITFPHLVKLFSWSIQPLSIQLSVMLFWNIVGIDIFLFLLELLNSLLRTLSNLILQLLIVIFILLFSFFN